MRKKLSQSITFVFLFLIIGIFIGISLTSLVPSITTTTTTITNKVCCHSFGFGSEMKRCCDRYEWATADGCKVPEGMIGGGKEIVDNSYCVYTTTTTIPTTTTIKVCPTMMACLYNPTSNNYKMFTGCDYSVAKSSGWIETNFTNPNYCNTDDDCICSLTKCFRGNKYYADCVQDVNACQMSYCPFTPEQRMVCIDHFCQIGTI